MNAATARLGAVIVAAGSGIRMGGLDKLFTQVAGRPLLAHAIAPFQASPSVERVVLVLAPDNVERARVLAQDQGFSKVGEVVAGGERRQDSVRLGLAALGACEYVAVHDGGRPLVSVELIERGLSAAGETGAAVAALPLVDTVKEAGADGLVLRTVDRSRLWATQTPQVFRYELLARAHREVTADVTDDAAMVEALGLPVKVFPGERWNIKVTTAEDLELVRAVFENESLRLKLSAGLIRSLTNLLESYLAGQISGRAFRDEFNATFVDATTQHPRALEFLDRFHDELAFFSTRQESAPYFGDERLSELCREALGHLYRVAADAE